MATAHHRRKQPERVRRALLDCVAKLAAEQGLAAVTIQAVADAAGVTKGGLLHHFASKQALIEAVFADLLDQLDREIEALMAADPDAVGRFTRAYVRACFADRMLGATSLWAALAVSLITEPALRQLWSQWLVARLERHRDTDDMPTLAVVRLAADGVWLSDLLEKDSVSRRDVAALEPQLLALTRLSAAPRQV